MEYSNPFYNENYADSKPMYATDGLKVTEYNGYLIVKHSDILFHIVKDETCLSMMAGINGAKNLIESWQK